MRVFTKLRGLCVVQNRRIHVGSLSTNHVCVLESPVLFPRIKLLKIGVYDLHCTWHVLVKFRVCFRMGEN